MNDAIIATDDQTRVTSWNRVAAEMFGWTAKEVLGQPVSTILGTEFVGTDDHEITQTLLETGRWRGEVITHRRDGSDLLCEVTGMLFREAAGRPAGFVAVARDISERARAESALRESEQRYRQMFEKNRAVKLLIDPSTGAIVQANAAACEFYGYSPDQLHRMKITDINTLPPDQVQAEMARANAEERTYFTFRHRLASGEIKDVAVYSSPLVLQGRLVLYSIVQDVTEQRRAEESLQEAMQTLRRHTERLSILHQIDRAILSAKSANEIAHVALTRIRGVVPCRRAGVWLYDVDDCQARLLAVDVAGETRLVPGSCVSLNDFDGEAGIEARDIPAGDDLMATPQLSQLAGALQAEGVRSLVTLPLVVGTQAIGSLNLGLETPDPVSDEDLEFVRQVADSLAVAIQDARLYEAEQHARQVADKLRATNLALTVTLDLDEILGTLLDNLASLVPYDSASVMLLQNDFTMAICALRGYERWTDVTNLKGRTFALETTPTIQRLFSTRQTLLISDTRSYMGWQPTPGSEHIRSWMGVPLLSGGKVIGLCSLDLTRPHGFTEEHVRLAEAVAAQAATAAQNARLYEQVNTGRERLQALSRRLVEVQEGERRRIARELHDDAGQALTSMMVSLRLLEREAGEREAVLARAADLRRTADSVLENLHRLAMDLRPASLDHVGLVSALRQYVETFGRQNGLDVQYEVMGLENDRLLPEVETSIYRIVQEALTNVARHGHATRVAVLLERRGDRVLAIIEDNGVGFDRDEAASRGRMGLFGMRERAEMVGGDLTFESSPGVGTTVFVEVPYGH